MTPETKIVPSVMPAEEAVPLLITDLTNTRINSIKLAMSLQQMCKKVGEISFKAGSQIRIPEYEWVALDEELMAARQLLTELHFSE